VFLRHYFLAVLSFVSSLASSGVVALLLVQSVIIVLLDDHHEWLVVSMFLGAAPYDALAHLHHWLQVVGVWPGEYSAKIQQAFLALFLVCAQCGPWHVILFVLMIVQGTLPSSQPWKTSRLTRAFSQLDQLIL
jgi:hypothetical protein